MKKVTGREWKAIAVTLVLLIFGVLISYWQCDAGWLSRFGALIIITGVVFAFTDLPVILNKKAMRMIKLRTELTISDAITQLEDEDHTLLTDEQRGIVRKILTPSEQEINNEVNKGSNRIYLLEVIIICFGTFINGFGEYLLSSLWKTV